MSVGFGGMGRLIGGAYVRLSIDDRPFYRQLDQARRAMAGMTKLSGAMGGAARAPFQVGVGLGNAIQSFGARMQAFSFHLGNWFRVLSQGLGRFQATASMLPRLHRTSSLLERLGVRIAAVAMAIGNWGNDAALSLNRLAAHLRGRNPFAMIAARIVGRLTDLQIAITDWMGKVTSHFKMVTVLIGGAPTQFPMMAIRRANEEAVKALGRFGLGLSGIWKQVGNAFRKYHKTISLLLLGVAAHVEPDSILGIVLTGTSHYFRSLVNAFRSIGRGIGRLSGQLARGIPGVNAVFHGVIDQVFAFFRRLEHWQPIGRVGTPGSILNLAQRASGRIINAVWTTTSYALERMTLAVANFSFKLGTFPTFQKWVQSIRLGLYRTYVRVNGFFLDLNNEVYNAFLWLSARIGQVTFPQMLAGAASAIARGTRAVTGAMAGTGVAIGRAIFGMARPIGDFLYRTGNVAQSVVGGVGRAVSAVGSVIARVSSGLGRAVGATGSVIGAVATPVVRMAGAIVGATVRLLATVTRALGSVAGGIARSALRLGTGFVGAGLGVGVLTGGIAGAFSLAYIIEQSKAMEVRMVALQRILGDTRQETTSLAGSFFEMGTALAGVSLDKIFELGTMASRLGVPREQIDLFTRDLSKAATVVDIEIDELAVRVSGLIDVFGLAHVDAIRFASALNELDISSNASAREILDITNRMSGAASAIGLTAQQTLGLSTALRQARIPLETAGTAMSQILGRMTSVRDMPEFARLAGMRAGAFQELLGRDALAAFVAVEQGLKRLSPIERFRALDRLHLDGQRVRLTMLQLLNVLDELDEYVGIANSEWSSMASILRGFNLQATTASAMLQRMWNNIQLTAVAIGKALLPIVKGLAEGISALSTDIRGFIEGNGARMEAWGRSVGDTLESLGALWRQWNRIVGTADAPGILRNAWSSFWDQFRANALDAWNQFRDNALVAIGNIPKFLNNVMMAIPALVGQVVNYLSVALPPLAENLGKVMLRGLVAGIPDWALEWVAPKGVDVKKFRAEINAPKFAPVPGPKGFFGPMPDLMAGLDVMPGWRKLPGFGGMRGFLDDFWAVLEEGMKDQRGEMARRRAVKTIQDWFTRIFADIEHRRAPPGVRMAPDAGLPGFQFGGDMEAGVPGIVGEGGPEVFVPRVPGRIIPNAGLGADYEFRRRLARMAMLMRMGGSIVPGVGLAADIAGGLGSGAGASTRHMELLAWRERVRQRAMRVGNRTGGRITNPWVQALRERQQAMWEQSGAGAMHRAAVARRQRRESLTERHRGAVFGRAQERQANLFENILAQQIRDRPGMDPAMVRQLLAGARPELALAHAAVRGPEDEGFRRDLFNILNQFLTLLRDGAGMPVFQ